jgi:ABC-type Fe3+/spermidine/putrescine transport system ATPase subunit
VISDRIAVMKAGVIQQVGTSWQIYKQPVNTFVASFVGNTNFIDGAVTSRQNGHIEVAIDGLCVKAPKPTKSLKTVRLAILPEDLSIVHDQGSVDECTNIPANIEKVTFTGSLVQYALACEGGQQLIVERHKPEQDALIPKGSSVFIRIPFESILLFDPDTGQRI